MTSRLFYFKDILKIAAPIIMGNLGFMMIGVGDVIVAGRHSTNTLAAVCIATAITNCIMMFGIGILVSIPATLSNYRGKKKQPEKAAFYGAVLLHLFLVGLRPTPRALSRGPLKRAWNSPDVT